MIFKQFENLFFLLFAEEPNEFPNFFPAVVVKALKQSLDELLWSSVGSSLRSSGLKLGPPVIDVSHDLIFWTSTVVTNYKNSLG